MTIRTKKIMTGMIFIVILLGTFNLIFKGQSLSQILSIIQNVDPHFIIIAFFMMVLFIFCDALKLYTLLTNFKQKTCFLKTIGYSFVGFYFSSITPSASGGQPAQIFYMNKDNIKLSYASLTLLLTTIIYQCATIIYGLLMFVINYQFINDQLEGVGILLLISTVVNSIVICLMILAMFSQRFIFKFAKYTLQLLSKLRIVKHQGHAMETVNQILTEYQQSADYVKKNPKLILRITLLTFIQMTALYLIPYFIYCSFDLHAHSPLQIVGAQSLISLAVSSLPLPGGMGISENSFLTMFKVFFGTTIIVPAMLLSRLVSFYVILLISALITLIVHLRTNQNKCIYKMEDIV